MPGRLTLLATPIGNLGDLTLRGIEALRACDAVACEDTRVTSKLLAHLGVQKPLLSIHVHSDDARIAQVLDRIAAGEHVVYACDAGTPNMNDPGGKLAAAAYERGLAVEPLPGASALTVAISACGFPMESFAYEGFVPHKKGRETFFRAVAERSEPTVFLESTHRMEKTMDGLAKALPPDRRVFVGRELTKLHETLYRGTVAEVRAALAASSWKGEFIVVVGPSYAPR